MWRREAGGHAPGEAAAQLQRTAQGAERAPVRLTAEQIRLSMRLSLPTRTTGWALASSGAPALALVQELRRANPPKNYIIRIITEGPHQHVQRHTLA